MKVLRTALLACTLVLSATTYVQAQTPMASLMGGWRWGGSMSVREGKLSLAPAVSYGAEISIPAPAGSGFLQVGFQPTTLRLQRINTGVQEDLFKMDVWSFMLGGRAEVASNGPAIPFGNAAIGVSWFNPKDASSGSETMLAGFLGGGVLVPMGADGNVKLRLEAKMHLNIPWAGGSLWCGSGGCYGGVGGYVGPVQGEVMGGFSFAFGGRPGAAGRGRR